MQPTDTLTTFFQHNRWANVRLLERCAKLSREQLSAVFPGVFGSISETLAHIVTSERVYVARISTGQRWYYPEDMPPLTIQEMIDSAHSTGTSLIEWAHRVSAEDTVMLDWDGTPRETPKTIILTQAINHATDHRAQITIMMTQLGIEPPDLQSWSYFDESDSSYPFNDNR